MSKSSKIWLCISISMILIGCILFGGVMTMLNWDFSKLSPKYETNTYEIEQPVQNITIAIKTADIVFMPSENRKASVICYEQEKVKHNVSVEDDILAISVTDTREWYDYIGIHFKTPKITVCLPQ